MVRVYDKQPREAERVSWPREGRAKHGVRNPEISWQEYNDAIPRKNTMMQCDDLIRCNLSSYHNIYYTCVSS